MYQLQCLYSGWCRTTQLWVGMRAVIAYLANEAWFPCRHFDLEDAMQQLPHPLQPGVLEAHHALACCLNLAGQPAVQRDEQHHYCQSCQEGIPHLQTALSDHHMYGNQCLLAELILLMLKRDCKCESCDTRGIIASAWS